MYDANTLCLEESTLEENEKTVEHTKREQIRPTRQHIDPALKARQSRTVKHQRTTRASRVTRVGTQGKDNVQHRGSIELLLILGSMHITATDRP